VIEAVGKLPAREDLSVRLGIATGLAVVGDLIGEGAAQERGVVGETPNLAARLQALAEPGCVIVGDGTRRLLGSLSSSSTWIFASCAASPSRCAPGGSWARAPRKAASRRCTGAASRR